MLIRSGRYLLNAGRFDESNSMEENGELRLVREIVAWQQKSDGTLSVLDIGANVGAYTLAVAAAAAAARLSKVKILAVEACSATLAILKENLNQTPYAQTITPLHAALSDHSGTAQFNVIAPGAGRNSLLPVEEGNGVATEEVQVSTIDEIFSHHNFEKIDLVKIDTEGHDYAVLCGASDALQNEKIGVVQFEYNWRWIEQRAYLRDVFRLIEEMPYTLGKVTPQGIEFFDRWAPQLETLIENNYAVVHQDLVPHFSSTATVSTC